MAAYKYGGPVPTAPNDPDPYFFTDGPSNCYGYAVNYPGDINPGGRCGNSTQIHGNMARGDLEEFNKYCKMDGLTYLGKNRPDDKYYQMADGWLVALFANTGDMHWARLDSNKVWSDKMPKDKPQRSLFQYNGEKPKEPHEVVGIKDFTLTLIFQAYYWVDANVPTKSWVESICIIM